MVCPQLERRGRLRSKNDHSCFASYANLAGGGRSLMMLVTEIHVSDVNGVFVQFFVQFLIPEIF